MKIKIKQKESKSVTKKKRIREIKKMQIFPEKKTTTVTVIPLNKQTKKNKK